MEQITPRDAIPVPEEALRHTLGDMS
jgi:hypothetical protein